MEFQWVKEDILRDGVFPTECPVKKGFYYTRNFVPNARNFPASLPWTNLKIENSYEITLTRLQILETNVDYIDFNMTLNKFSRTQAGISLNFTLFHDLPNDTYISVQLYGEYSNAYRRLPIRVGRSICDTFIMEFQWVKEDILKDGVFPTKCPVKKSAPMYKMGDVYNRRVACKLPNNHKKSTGHRARKALMNNPSVAVSEEACTFVTYTTK
ncbi:hypothetical protein CBL_07379 [Carabus blaptoides fortunei]